MRDPNEPAEDEKLFIKDKEDELDLECMLTAGELSGSRAVSALTVPAMADVSSIWIHGKRGTVHYGHLEDNCKLGCGRAKTQVFLEMGDSAEGLWPRCGDCLPEEGTIL